MRRALVLVALLFVALATLVAISEIASRSVFHWYSGHTGDTSQPLESYGPQAVYVPSVYRVQYAWVEVVTPCSTSTAEFTINVPLPKSRAVRG
jgi:hypothetical protein